MKKVISFCLASTLFFIFAACSADSGPVKSPVNYYYQTADLDYNSADGMIALEIRKASGHTNDYPYLIAQYLNGPEGDDCTSPFPAGITLEEFEIDSNKAMLTLSSHITTLSGSELMFACVCLTKTVSEMTGARSVQIATANGTINGNSSITLTPDSFVLWNGQ